MVQFVYSDDIKWSTRTFKFRMKNTQPKTSTQRENRLTACGHLVCLTLTYIYSEQMLFFSFAALHANHCCTIDPTSYNLTTWHVMSHRLKLLFVSRVRCPAGSWYCTIYLLLRLGSLLGASRKWNQCGKRRNVCIALTPAVVNVNYCVILNANRMLLRNCLNKW